MNISLAFRDDLEGSSEGEGREARRGGDLYIITPDCVVVWQKPTQCCKATFLQTKNCKIEER